MYFEVNHILQDPHKQKSNFLQSKSADIHFQFYVAKICPTSQVGIGERQKSTAKANTFDLDVRGFLVKTSHINSSQSVFDFVLFYSCQKTRQCKCRVQ